MVRQEMAQCDADKIATAELIISELVSNAVLHASTAIIIECLVANNQFRASVSDHDNTLPFVRQAGPSDVHGRGMKVVDALADDWGSLEISTGKSVWFTLRCQEGVG